MDAFRAAARAGRPAAPPAAGADAPAGRRAPETPATPIISRVKQPAAAPRRAAARSGPPATAARRRPDRDERAGAVAPGRREPVAKVPAADAERSPHPPASPAVSWAQAPFVAIQFLTVLPPLVRRPLRAADLGRSESFFPLAGLLLGAALASIDVLLGPWVARPVRDVLLVALLAGLTGALHLDGVIDTADGLFAHGGRERRLEIMRDPRAGAFGVIAVVLLLLLKVAALGTISDEARPLALILAPGLGRWAIVLVTRLYPYARSEGMGRDFKDAVRWPHAALAGTIAAAAAWLLGGVVGLGIWLFAGLAALLFGRWVAARLGGLTGDTYGATCELVEAGVLVAVGTRLGSMAVGGLAVGGLAG